MPTLTKNFFSHYTLSLKLLFFLLIGIIGLSQLLISQSEQILEKAILDQTKRQAVTFLNSIEHQLQQLATTPDLATLQTAVDRAKLHPSEHGYSFVINSIYIYDTSGKVVAHSTPGTYPDKDMSGHYGDVVNNNTPYMGNEIEYEEGMSGQAIPMVDVIAPLVLKGITFGGIEAELDLRNTMQLIKQQDDIYETELIGIITAASFILLVFISVVSYRWLVKPVHVMRHSTALIANGDFSTRVENVPNNELGDLANSINLMALSLQQLFDRQELAYMESLKALIKALEAKDSYTATHSSRVAHYATLLGKRIGLDAEQLKLLHQGCLMHDLGKIGIPDSILNKTTKLDEREYEIIQQHPKLTAAIMRPLSKFKAFSDVARWHHERWDGAGYPDGLSGEEIPLLARIVAIADTWDAMTGDRVYRKGMAAGKAISIMENERDHGQWDPNLLDIFIEMIKEDMRVREEVTNNMLG